MEKKKGNMIFLFPFSYPEGRNKAVNRAAYYHKGPLGLPLMWRHGKLKFTAPRALLPPPGQEILTVFVLGDGSTCSSPFCPASSLGESSVLHWEQSCITHRQAVRYVNCKAIIPFENEFFSDFLLPPCPCPLSLLLELILLLNSQKPAEIAGEGWEPGSLQCSLWMFCSQTQRHVFCPVFKSALRFPGIKKTLCAVCVVTERRWSHNRLK